jgi:hypothetical protein
MAADDGRRIGRRRETVAEAFAAEAPLLAPLPDTPFDCARLLEAKVDPKSGSVSRRLIRETLMAGQRDPAVLGGVRQGQVAREDPGVA